MSHPENIGSCYAMICHYFRGSLTRKRSVLNGCLLPLALAFLCFGLSANAAPGWNFILILVDDLGWTDLGCMGSTFYRTPHIDRLAARGLRFTGAYSACTVCSPTRAAILTGKYPARLHITDWIEGHKRPAARLQVPDWRMHLPHEEITLPEALQAAGYVSASIGKWHLGREPFRPDTHGFEVALAGDHRGQPPSYFSPYKIPALPEGPEGEFLTDRECAEALRFIDANRARPFLLYLPHYAVHTPIQAKKDVTEKYRARARESSGHKNPAYAALIESVDDSVGRLVARLEELELAERTVIIFTSDNGGLLPVTSNAPLRAGKGSAYEGGVRVPLIVHWPGVTQPPGIFEAPVISMDLYPTILEIAGVKPRPGQVIDGKSLVPALKQGRPFPREALFWHYPHYHPGGATPYGAIRAGDWKLIEFFEDQRVELYDLGRDPGEQTDLAGSLPDRAQQLRERLAVWRRAVGAQMPAPNPRYDPARAALSAARVSDGFKAATRVAIVDGQWRLNDRPTYPGTRAEGLLINVRMVNSTFEDRRRPEFDPQANTARFVRQIPDYAAHGVRAFTLCLQGGMPGYEGALNSAFEADGTLRGAYLDRVRQVIETCDRRGLAVILGCFYQRQDQVLRDATAVQAGVSNVVRWIQRAGFNNVALEIANEFDHGGFDHSILKTVAGQVELIRFAKRLAPDLLVSTSGLGHGRLPDEVARASDFLLIHFNGTSLEDIPARIAALKKFGKPIVCNEDDKTGAAAARAAELCVANGASWGLMLKEVNQYFPLEFNGAADDPVVYQKLKELTLP